MTGLLTVAERTVVAPVMLIDPIFLVVISFTAAEAVRAPKIPAKMTMTVTKRSAIQGGGQAFCCQESIEKRVFLDGVFLEFFIFFNKKHPSRGYLLLQIS